MKDYNHKATEKRWPHEKLPAIRGKPVADLSRGKQKVYNHLSIERKWQRKWTSSKLYKTEDFSKKEKFYVLDMFPYPSGEGLHVGHPKGYIATDIVSRMKRMQGYNVLHPMGFDAFGLPAENYAIKTKTNPIIAVAKNVARYKKQLEILGFDYDWSREVNTTDPKYYKWTQWIFLKLLENDLAYETFEPINWCPSCKTGLANEDVEDGRCERCTTPVEKKTMRQWALRITKYADKLLQGLDSLDWPESIKEAQRNWIGRSEGALIKFKVHSLRLKFSKIEDIEIFTTRPDTLFGVTYVVLAPEHALVTEILKNKENLSNHGEVVKYVAKARIMTEIERTDAKKDKTGVTLEGITAINPVNGKEVPVWVADYVLADYGTGAVMAVPAHDARDFEFAKKYNVAVHEVISGGDISKGAYEGEGKMINSGKFTGRASNEVKNEITKFVNGEWVTRYKLRDWVFSRQRYWGEPIPVLHDSNGKVIPVLEKNLPVVLPKVKHYEPTGTGESPLADIKNWLEVKLGKGKGAKILKRETNTMPQWAGSSWYYLRYMDPKNSKKLVSPESEKYWNQVDFYVGGAEHATRHLIYARFWHKFLHDIGVVSTNEPFKKLQHVGLIMGEDGRKMSKRFNNVVNPDEIVSKYGADTLRVYEMFMGPFDGQIAWSTASIIGSRRFLERIWKLQTKLNPEKVAMVEKNSNLEILLNKTIKKVGEDILAMRFNTAISSLMILQNEFDKTEFINIEYLEKYLKILAPFAPHLTEELWYVIGNKKSIHISEWPNYNEDLIKESKTNIAVQVNGKTRGVIEQSINDDEETVKANALTLPEVAKWLSDKKIEKVIYVKGKIINIMVS